MKYPKGSQEQISKDFKAREMDCPCGKCSVTIIDDELPVRLQKLRDALDQALKINSGYRCDDYQANLKARGFETAAGRSTHQDGRAVDIESSGKSGNELEVLARAAGFKAVGVARHWAHIDLRDDKERFWTYAY